MPDSSAVGPVFEQIGTEGGILPQVADIKSQPVGFDYNRRSITVLNVSTKALYLGPAERADVIVDFSNVPAGSKLILYNDAPAPVPAFDPRNDYFTGDPDNTSTGGAPSTAAGYGPNTRTIMQFQVGTPQDTSFNLTTLKTDVPKIFAATPGQADRAGEGVRTRLSGRPAYTKDTYVRIQDTSVWNGGPVTGMKVVTAGTGYTSAPTVTILGGNGSGATAHAVLSATGTIDSVVVDTGGTGYTISPVVVLTGGGGSGASVTALGWLPMQPKAIQELFEVDYGRMNATMGVELPFTNMTNQTTIPLGYAEPATEYVSPSDLGTPVGSLGDGTQIWKITHNGVDTHAVHFHLWNVELINRVGWDGQIKPPLPQEQGWKDTVIMNPLEDCIVALRPVKPNVPFAIPDSIRALDVTMPLGAPITTFDVTTGAGITIPNALQNYGWEYVWHCHLLSHEEMDMMRPVVFQVAPEAPSALTAALNPAQTSAVLNWTDNSKSATGFDVQRARRLRLHSQCGQQPRWGAADRSGRAVHTGCDDVHRLTLVSTGNYWFRVRATSANGTSAWSNTMATVPDLIAPTITALAAPAPNAAGWNNSNVTVTFTAVDNVGGSGVASVTYTVNGVATTVATNGAATATISVDGQKVITFLATDNAGNASVAQTLAPPVWLDKTAPLITSASLPAANAAGWNNANTTVTLNASDATSGLASASYTVNGGAAVPVTVTAGAVQAVSIPVTTEGTTTIIYTALDVAGNTATNTTIIKLDKTAPVAAVSQVPASQRGRLEHDSCHRRLRRHRCLELPHPASPPSPTAPPALGRGRRHHGGRHKPEQRASSANGTTIVSASSPTSPATRAHRCRR